MANRIGVASDVAGLLDNTTNGGEQMTKNRRQRWLTIGDAVAVAVLEETNLIGEKE
jgi:hypothetical protein